MTKREYVTVTVVSQEGYVAGPFNFGDLCVDGTLNEVIASLCAIRDSIPEEYRDVASCRIGSEGGYEDSHYPSITVTYDRLETPVESAARLEEASAWARRQEADQRALFELLKAKFEAPQK